MYLYNWCQKHKMDIYSVVVLFFVALIVRVLDLGVFLTADEKNWLGRSYEFIKAFKDFRFNDMLQTTHPGVTTLWLSGLAVTLKMYLSHTPFAFNNLAVFIAPAQAAIALANAILIPIIYFLLRQLLPHHRRLCLIAALFITLDPFLVGYSRVVHVDALLAGFLFAAALSAILYAANNFSRSWLAVAAIFSALALLTKAPAIFCLPYLLLVVLAYHWRNLRSRAFILDRVRDLLIWALLVAIIILTIWPAILLVPNPEGNVLVLKRDLSIAAATPHHMAEEYSLNGMFYVYSILSRTTPVTLGFSIAALIFGILYLVLSMRRIAPAAINDNQHQIFVWLLFAYVFFFALMMTLGAKKGDRYILPVFPAIDVMAALGIVVVARFFGNFKFKILNLKILTEKNIFSAVAGVSLIYLSMVVFNYHPYAIAYSNPLFPDNLSEELGWGEGLEQVGAWLNEHDPNTAVASWYPEELGAFTSAHVAHINAHQQGRVKYVVLYRNMFGRAPDHYANDFIDEYYKKRNPVHIVSIVGKEFAWVYSKWVFEQVVGELIPGQIVSQEIPIKQNGLSEVQILVATYSGRAMTGDLLVELAPAGGQTSQVWRTPIKNIADGAWLKLSLDPSLSFPPSPEEAQVKIWTEGTQPGDAPTIRYARNNRYRTSNFYLRGKEIKGDLAIRLAYNLNGQIVTEEDSKLLNTGAINQ